MSRDLQWVLTVLKTNFWFEMKIIVTGGAGFIGSHIVDACKQSGHNVEVIDDLSSGSSGNVPEDIPLHKVDIRNTQIIADIFQ